MEGVRQRCQDTGDVINRHYFLNLSKRFIRSIDVDQRIVQVAHIAREIECQIADLVESLSIFRMFRCSIFHVLDFTHVRVGQLVSLCALLACAIIWS